MQAIYGYDVRTEVVGSKGSVLIGSVEQNSVTFLTSAGGSRTLADHFLSRFEDAYVIEMQDFLQRMLHDRAPRISGEDGLRALEIAVAAQNSYLQSKPSAVSQVKETIVHGGGREK